MAKETTSITCELCSETAVIYCPSDSAYLCWNCDRKVHEANFLVARHRRSTLDGQEFGSQVVSSLSSVCVSSTDQTVKCSTDQEVESPLRRFSALDAKAEGVLVNWCRRLGIRRYGVVSAASKLLLGGGVDFVPLRVALATSFWLGLKLCGETRRDLKAVEKITGVSGGMILAAEAKLKRVLKTRSHSNEEGWAETE